MNSSQKILICLILVIVSLSACIADDPSVHPRMLTIPGGTFIMGLDQASEEATWEKSSTPSRKVRLSSFLVSETVVSRDQFARFVAEKGYSLNDMVHEEEGSLLDNTKDGSSPIIFVSWNEAVLYCNWLSAKAGLEPVYSITGAVPGSNRQNKLEVSWNRKANGYRLLTEAEYEYLLRDGGKNPAELDLLYGWHGGYLLDEAPSGSKTRWEPIGPADKGVKNGWGVVFMAGMREWLWSFGGRYSAQDLENPEGPDFIINQKLRKNPGYIYNSYFYRSAGQPEGNGFYISIRLARNAP